MPWPEPDWTPVQPFPFTAARSAFAGMTDDKDKVVLRYFKRQDGALVATASFGPRAEGAPGLVHGGATLTALDEALGAAAWVAGVPCLTVRLETEFRRALPVGTPCLVTTHIETMRHGLADVAGELAGADGTVYARALGRYKRLTGEGVLKMFGRALPALPALAALWLAGAPAAAETMTKLLGPLQLKGVQRPMAGPMAMRDIHFEQPGWITGLSARVLDTQRRPHPDQSLLCHLSWRHGDIAKPRHSLFTLSPGATSLRLPAGFGIPVKAGKLSRLETMVQSADAGRDERLFVEALIDFMPRTADGPSLEPLWHADLGPDPRELKARRLDGVDKPVWWVPTGTHTYQNQLSVPLTGRLHATLLHLHHHATRVRLEKALTGEVILDGPVRADAAGLLLEAPSYSDAKGLPVTKGEGLLMSVTYDNPRGEDIVAMSSVHVFIRPERPLDELPAPTAPAADHSHSH